MENNLKLNFENYLNEKNLTNSQKEIKESNFDNFIKNGFPNKRIEDWKFSDLKQIISNNFDNINFLNREIASSIDESLIDDLEHNKIVFINGVISKIDFSYENEDKIIVEQNSNLEKELSDNVMLNLNTAFVSNYTKILVKSGYQFQKPLFLFNYLTKDLNNAGLNSRLDINLEDDVALNIVNLSNENLYNNFLNYAENNFKRNLSWLDRDIDSPTYGSFDRNYWHYKITDFNSDILQQGLYTLISLYRGDIPNDYNKLRLRELILASTKYTINSFKKKLFFNEYYPNEDGYPPLAFISNLLGDIFNEFPEFLDSDKISSIYKRINLYLSTLTEVNASNQYAVGISGLYKFLKFYPDLKIKINLNFHIKNLLKLQNDIEGWFNEYDGFDLGYLSVTLEALSDIYEISKEKRIILSIDKIIDFVYKIIDKDGELPFTINSRNTEYFLPYGLVKNLKRNSKGKLVGDSLKVSTYGNAEPPADNNAWANYLKEVIKFMVSTYGSEKIGEIQFNIGREIGTPSHWSGTKEQFFEFYKISSKAIHKVLPKAKVGTHFLWGSSKNAWGTDFVKWANANNVHYDFVGVSFYPFYQRSERTDFDKVYNKDFAVIKDIPEWNKNAKLEMHEYSLIKSLSKAGNSFKKAPEAHQNSFMIGLMKMFYQNNMQNIFQWGDGSSYLPASNLLLTMQGNTYFESKKEGKQQEGNNYIDAIFTKDAVKNKYNVLVYNYSANPDANNMETIKIKAFVNIKKGTKVKYRIAEYNKIKNNVVWSNWIETYTLKEDEDKSSVVFSNKLPVFSFLKYEVVLLTESKQKL